MSDSDWDLSVTCRIRWYKVLRPPPLHVGHRDDGAHQPGGPRASKHVKTALMILPKCWVIGLIFARSRSASAVTPGEKKFNYH